VFAAGRAGTVQEVFQAATKTYYGSDGASGPYVFLGSAYWTELAAPALLGTLLARTPAGDQRSLIHLTDDVATAVALLTAPPKPADVAALTPAGPVGPAPAPGTRPVPEATESDSADP
jgi:hypothetical protein